MAPSHRKPNDVLTNFSAYLRRRVNPRPLVSIAIGFCIGCVVFSTAKIASIIAAFFLIFGLVALAHTKAPLLTAILLVCVGVGLGFARATYSKLQPQLSVTGERLVSVRGEIATLPQERSFTIGFTLQASQIISDRHVIHIDQPIAIRLLGGAEERARRLDEGDLVTISGVLSQNLAGSPDSPALEVVSRAPDDVGIAEAPSTTVLQRISSRCKTRIENILRRELGQSDAAVMNALLLGDRSDLDPATSSAFVDTGAAHLLATAGLHMGIIAWALMSLLRSLTVPRKLSASICILAVWVYAIMAGSRPAVERAAFVASVYFAAILLERIPDPLSALALCSIVTLWIDPTLMADSGFQMTFITVAGIIAIMTPLADGLDTLWDGFGLGHIARWSKRFVEVELLSVAAQASAAPLVAYYYNLVAAGSVVANLIAVPLMVLLLPSTLAAVAVGSIWLPAGAFLGHNLVMPLLHGVVGAVTWVSSARLATVSVVRPSITQIIIYYIVLIGGSVAAQSYSRSLSPSGGAGFATRAIDPHPGKPEPALA